MTDGSPRNLVQTQTCGDKFQFIVFIIQNEQRSY